MRRPLSLLATLALAGCHIDPPPRTLEEISGFLAAHADCTVLSTNGTSSVLVSPRLQGRILTARVGDVASTGYVPFQSIAEGETHEHFNNFGGVDRFWIGPEAGQFGIYFPPGARELTRDNWQVPAAFDKGALTPLAVTAGSVTRRRRRSSSRRRTSRASSSR